MIRLLFPPEPFTFGRRDDRCYPPAAAGHEGDLAVDGLVQNVGELLPEIGCTDLSRTVSLHALRVPDVRPRLVLYGSVVYGSVQEGNGRSREVRPVTSTDRYPRLIGTLDGHEVWEDDPGSYWVDDPADPGYLMSRSRPRLDGEPARRRSAKRGGVQ